VTEHIDLSEEEPTQRADAYPLVEKTNLTLTGSVAGLIKAEAKIDHEGTVNLVVFSLGLMIMILAACLPGMMLIGIALIFSVPGELLGILAACLFLITFTVEIALAKSSESKQPPWVSSNGHGSPGSTLPSN
jgi:hypothetical protein